MLLLDYEIRHLTLQKEHIYVEYKNRNPTKSKKNQIVQTNHI